MAFNGVEKLTTIICKSYLAPSPQTQHNNRTILEISLTRISFLSSEEKTLKFKEEKSLNNNFNAPRKKYIF